VDQPTSRRGRRGLSAESVSVKDLLDRTTPEEKAAVSAIQERAAAETSAKTAKPSEDAGDQADATGQPPTEGDPATATDQPRVSRLVTRTIMVATAVILLCGAVTVFAVLITARSPRLSPSTPVIGPAKIAGPIVVRPGLLNKQLAAGLPTTVHSDGSAVTAGDLISSDEVHTERLSGPAQASGTGTANPRAEEIRKVILDFYAAAPETYSEKQDAAFEMLGPEMRGDGLAGFKQSWDARDPDKRAKLLVQVARLEVDHGGVACATVLIAWPNATVLRTEQLLVVSEGPNPKIVRAELFSAHRD
jgi:hypothetical protein